MSVSRFNVAIISGVDDLALTVALTPLLRASPLLWRTCIDCPLSAIETGKTSATLFSVLPANHQHHGDLSFS